MRRVIGWSIPLVLIAFGLLWPLVFTGGHDESPASDPVVFSNYKVDLVVSADGRLDAVETITAEFPGDRHGLFKFWPVDNQNVPRVRQIPDVTSIMLDGHSVPYQMLWEDGKRFRVAKIGDPEKYLSYGTHVFEIRYSIPGYLTRAASEPTKPSPTRSATARGRRRRSIGTSSARRGTTASTAPKSRFGCPAT